MIQNSLSWHAEQLPKLLVDLLSDISSGEQEEDLEQGEAYAQYLFNPENGAEHYHIGYIHRNEQNSHEVENPFRQEFVITVIRSSEEEWQMHLLYHPEAIEIYDYESGYEFKLVNINKSRLDEVVEYLADQEGLFSISQNDQPSAV